MSKEKTKTIDMKHKTFGAVREGERERYTLLNRENAYANQYVINNKRAGEGSALKVMDKKENQRQIS